MTTNIKDVSLLESSIGEEDEILALEKLLRTVEDGDVEPKLNLNENRTKTIPKIVEDSTFADTFSYELDVSAAELKKVETATKVIKDAEDFDSSDDEEVRNFLERKYNEYGSDINKRLKQQKESENESKVLCDVSAALKDHTSLSENNGNYEGHSDFLKNPHTPKLRQSLLTSSFKKTPPATKRENVTTKTHLTSLSSATKNPNICPIYTDPIFGLRITKPLVSSALLTERMSGRKAVPFSSLLFHIERGDLSKDWVVAGVLVNKQPTQSTRKGQPYSIWRFSDLHGEIKMVSLFLFGNAHKELWKTVQGMCIAILNPTIFEKRAKSDDIACLSIDTAQKLMVLGHSKDLGVCRAKKKNGESCTAVVNLSECDYCVFHMKQEYGKMSRRSELQAASNGRGLNELRNKVLGKSEVFYGGQSFAAIPAKKSSKLAMKDSQRLSSLSEYAVSPYASSVNHVSKVKNVHTTEVPYATKTGPISKVAGNIEVNSKQRLKDLERLKTLKSELNNDGKNCAEPINAICDSDTATTSKTAAQLAAAAAIKRLETMSNKSIHRTSNLDTPHNASPDSSTPDKFKNREFSSLLSKTPKLSRENYSIEIKVSQKRSELAKLKAAHILRQRPIERVNPNSIRGTEQGKRRAIDELNEKFQSQVAKKQKIEEEQRELDRQSRIQRIINATSSHRNLIDHREQQEQEKYFNKLEKKESLEEKMINTFKMACKAVICKICKYTAFSASERCKLENHPLKVVDAEKRFFECKDCGNRTVSVFKLPKTSCKNCKGSHWLRTGMMKERIVGNNPSESLSIRGDEEAFLGSLATKSNINLLIPDDA